MAKIKMNICLAAVAAVCAAFAAESGKMQLSEARAGIGDAISSPSAMASTMKSLSADDQVAFLKEVNAAIAKRQASKEEKTAMFLQANAAALRAAKDSNGDITNMLAEVYASASVDSLTAINEKFAEQLFNRAADPNQTYTDEQYAKGAAAMLHAIVARNDSSDNSSVRDVFGLLMLVRASNGTPDTLLDTLLQEIPEEDRKAAQEEWIPSALGSDGREKSYEPILSAADVEAVPNLDIVLKLYGPQQIDALLGNLIEGTPILKPHLGSDTTGSAFQSPIDASAGAKDMGDVPIPSSTPTPPPTPVPPAPPYQLQEI